MTDTTTCAAPDVEHPGFPCAHPAPIDEAAVEARYAELVDADLDAVLDLDHEPVPNGRWALCRACGHRTRADELSGVVRHNVSRYGVGPAVDELRDRLSRGWTWPDATECAVCSAVARVPSVNRPGQLVCVGCYRTRRAAEVEAARVALLGVRDRLAQLGYLDGHPAHDAILDALAAVTLPRTGDDA